MQPQEAGHEPAGVARHAQRGRDSADALRQVPRLYDPIRVLSKDQVAAIHQAALELLTGEGMRVLDGPAREFYRAGGRVQDGAVWLDPGLVSERLATVPARFTLATRNPEKSLRIGGGDFVFASTGGPAYAMDNAHDRELQEADARCRDAADDALLSAARAEVLDAYVARRKAEGGAPMN